VHCPTARKSIAMSIRFQFRLRTLMIVVALLAVLCGYVGWQAKIVRAREAALAATGRMLYQAGQLESRKDLPWMRWLLGDKQYREIILEDDAPDRFPRRSSCGSPNTEGLSSASLCVSCPRNRSAHYEAQSAATGL
jgi:hypothetical protein